MLFVCHPKTLQKPWLRFLLGVKMVRRETENNAYAKFWGDKDHHGMFMVFSGVVNCALNIRNSLQWFSCLTTKKIASQSVIPKATLLNQLYIIAVHTVKELFFCLSDSSKPYLGSSRVSQNPGDMDIPSHIALAIWVGVRVILENEKTLRTRLGSSLHGSSTLFDFWNNVLKSRPCKSALEPFFEQTTTVSVKNQNSLQTKNKSSPTCVICCFISEYM